MTPEEIAAIRDELDAAQEEGLRPAPQVLALLAEVERLRAEVKRLRIDRDEWNAAAATVWYRRADERQARLDKVWAESEKHDGGRGGCMCSLCQIVKSW